MAAKPGNTTARRRPGGRKPATERAEPDKTADVSDPFAELSEISAGDMLSVTRQMPAEHAGWLADIEVPAEALEDVRQIIKDQWGGGRYHLQWKRRGADNGRLRFAKGSAVITIAGPPAVVKPEVVAAPPPAAGYPGQPYPVAYAPPVAPSQDALANKVVSMLGEVMSRVPEAAQASTDVVGLVSAIASQFKPPEPEPRRDEFSMLDRYMGLMERIEERITARLGDGGTSSSTGSSLTGMPPQLEAAIASKFLNDTPQPQAAAGPGPQPSPNHLWHPVHGWVPAQPMRTAPPRAPAGPPPAAPSPHQDGPPAGGPPVDPGTTTTEDGENWTPSELADELAAMGPDDQREFMHKIMERMGANPDELAAMVKGPAGVVPDVAEPPASEDAEPPAFDVGYPETGYTDAVGE